MDRNKLTGSKPHSVHDICSSFSKNRRLQIDRLPFRRSSSKLKMDYLVRDFSVALEETSPSSYLNFSSKRRVLKRRSKSTSYIDKSPGKLLRADSSSSLDNSELFSWEQNTSSRHLTDSDLDLKVSAEKNTKKFTEYRSKRVEASLESDSIAENISPSQEIRSNVVKRKRKLKRITVESTRDKLHRLATAKYIKSKSCEERPQISGKRKRSLAEKNLEGNKDTYDKFEKSQPKCGNMEVDDLESSSSISDSEWDEDNVFKGPGIEADDEQSDWPGPETSISVMQLTDTEKVSPLINQNERTTTSGYRKAKKSITPENTANSLCANKLTNFYNEDHKVASVEMDDPSSKRPRKSFI